ncbi:hypothetical protein AM571_PC00874 (plasmid) [Rhizobium etli 8C-3]|uniref:Uncharacterized protein n=1 Tax=Rhizobium etli 8C-3 TaxID=538025 RepID=A0A1L5PEH8_RHIET|nr:hypothetical protein AM571_PC00874 [Rhizobium etli 8C-3]
MLRYLDNETQMPQVYSCIRSANFYPLKKASPEQLLARRSFLLALAQQTGNREQDKEPEEQGKPGGIQQRRFLHLALRFRMREG